MHDGRQLSYIDPALAGGVFTHVIDRMKRIFHSDSGMDRWWGPGLIL